MACTTCTNCSTCTCSTCVEINWSATAIAATLNPCITPDPCVDGCEETIMSDCVILSEDLTCEGNDYFIETGVILTNALKYIFCPDAFVWTMVVSDSCVSSPTGSITITTALTDYTFKLTQIGVTLQTITDPTLIFSSVAAGTYIVTLNDTVSQEVIVDDDGTCP